MVMFVYSILAPITNFIMAFCFLYMSSILRHQFIYVYPSVPDSGGEIWAKCINVIIYCMLIAELTSTLSKVGGHKTAYELLSHVIFAVNSCRSACPEKGCHCDSTIYSLGCKFLARYLVIYLRQTLRIG